MLLQDMILRRCGSRTFYGFRTFHSLPALALGLLAFGLTGFSALPAAAVPGEMTAIGLRPAVKPLALNAAQLPSLNWVERSDWVNVKTDVKPAAYGDGSHDDTSAIQAGLNMLSDTHAGAHTLYLPAGVYRITKTLNLKKIMGALIVGNGRDTRLYWTGATGGVMYRSNGVTRSRYLGLTWDGGGRAAVGVDHRSSTYYETRVRHQDEAFVNFTEAGIRVGQSQVVETAEVMYQNCLFQNDGNGVEFLEWNDYNNDFSGCDFRDCGTAINCYRGNVSVRQTHFERSRVSDFYLCNHSHSIRRCTSVGSRQFITTLPCTASCEVTVQDCHVDGWTGTQGAVAFAMRGPVTVFDSTFTHSPDGTAPIRLTNRGSVLQTATLSNNAAPDSSALLDPGPNSKVIEIPAGARGPGLSDPAQTFFHSTEATAAIVINAKTDCGAVGDGNHDDTMPIKNAIAAAKALGGGALVYLPTGTYKITSPLLLTGSGYTVGGAGFSTVLHWIGSSTGPVVAVQDPQSLALEQMKIEAPDNVACVQQTGGDGPSNMVYDGIYVGGSWLSGGPGVKISTTRTKRGLECVGLSAASVVHLVHFDGSMHFTNCSRAVILADFSVDGVVIVDGAQYEKSGFLGLQARDSTGNPYDVTVKDNQDLVITGYYTESTKRHLHVSGDGALLGQPGHVTVQGTKVNTFEPTTIEVDNYEGRVTYTGAQFMYTAFPHIVCTGTRPVDIVLLDNMFWKDALSVHASAKSQVTRLSNIVCGSSSGDTKQIVIDSLPGLGPIANGTLAQGAELSPAVALALADVSAALDDFRLLGLADLTINHP